VIALTASSEAAADALARKLPHTANIPGCLSGDDATNEATASGRSATRRSRATWCRRPADQADAAASTRRDQAVSTHPHEGDIDWLAA